MNQKKGKLMTMLKALHTRDDVDMKEEEKSQGLKITKIKQF